MRHVALRFLLLGFMLVLVTARSTAAVTVQARIDPTQANVGDEVTVTFTAKGGSIGDIQLPPVDGLSVEGSTVSSQYEINGFTMTQSISQAFTLVPVRAGDFTIPPISIQTNGGQVIRTPALRLHVFAGTANSAAPAPAAQPSPGPVVMPPASPDDNNVAPSPGDNSTISVPTDPDGQPARVFHLITPKTTDAYVGESIPLTIQFFIRADSNAQQNSLPTLIGSDFLMNNLSLRPAQDMVGISGEGYIRDTWITAISAPKAGDFPLEATRDTYWSQGTTNANDPFGGLFGRSAQLMHKEIGSNKLVIHVHPLPDQGRPENFTGAIGHFQVTGSASPGTVGVGEPVTLHFTVSGDGNFDYVRCPTLPSSADWRTYVANSKVTYEDESHTQATKVFDQSVIPQKNGTVALPAASFSYFDPDAKHYVTIPISLPAIVVTGEMPTAAAPQPATDETATASTPSAPAATSDANFRPNRLALGELTTSLAPDYQRPLFWVIQAVLAFLIIVGLLLLLFRPKRDPARAERALRFASRRQEELAMSRAAQEGDAVRFFTAARRVIQLQLAERWHVSAEALTLSEITRRDPALGETVAPLFAEADDVAYSGEARSGIDLGEWERRVREMLQPARL